MHVYKIVEPKSEVHAYFTSKQHRGCGASTSAVRKSEFKERGMIRILRSQLILGFYIFAPLWNPLAKNGEKRAWPKPLSNYHVP